MNEPQEDKSKEIDKPSDKQIALLKKLKLSIPNTKREATQLIKENISY